MHTRITILIICTLCLFTCSTKEDHLFRLVPASYSGLDFINTVEERDTINILTVQYMYHGGGVAVGDFNNDDLQDIFFTGNMVPNRLYLNRGNLKFEDVSKKANIGAADKWNSGVALADVNEDGLLDIYVCATINDNPEKRENSLFIHQGLDGNGVPTFKDEAKEYGIADQGYSQNAAFFDYDLDGDLDLYVLTNLESDKIPSNYRPKITDGSALNNDRLYRNNGNRTFTDVTMEAGILIEGYGLGIGIGDVNMDGWPDLYIGNDYVSNDVLYINNRDGTFKNEIRKRLKHQSLFSMGVDIADVNNDQLSDIITLDMLPEVNLRKKTMSAGGATYMNYVKSVEYDYEVQYMRNMLHVNNGNGTFSEVGQMSGIHQTEWSWSPLFIDVDNDGLKDLLITNGYMKDITDKDYVMFKREVGAFQHHRSLIDSMPILKVSNYIFKNIGDLSFKDMTKSWGMERLSFSNGAAFADFDNDGDVDYVVNNINDPAFLYENTLNNRAGVKNHFLRIKLNGNKSNKSGQGTKISVFYDSGKIQFHDHSIYRGYLSTVEDVVHFGLGKSTSIDSIQVEWPDRRSQTIRSPEVDKVLTVNQSDARKHNTLSHSQTSTHLLLTEVSEEYKLKYLHREWDKVDFYKQRTLPHKFSQAGPGIAVGDVNNDGREDFIIGGSSLYDATLFVQKIDGTFALELLPKASDRKSEDEGMLLFDADNDNDLDLYVVSGSYEFEAEDPRYQDRLYLNDGKGKFSHEPQRLPLTTASGSCVRAADYDADGDLDLFVGSRVITGKYPLPPNSYILRNENGKFLNVTKEVCAPLQKGGMITDALWTDFNNDKKIDLIVVGEFMPITIYQNNGSKFTRVDNTGLDQYSGWWNSLAAADFDQDGDIDYVIGNLGLNNYYNASHERPLRVYAKDVDGNGSMDPILSCYFKSEEGDLCEYPAHFWEDLNGQSPKFRNQFSSYKQFGRATMQDLLKPYDQNDITILSATHMQSSYAENKGDGTFTLRPLPREVQVGPVNGLLPIDINSDGNLDILVVGNDYGNEVFTGRYDALTGLVLMGDGKGNFKSILSVNSGFLVDGDAKALVRVNSAAGTPLILATQNLDSLKAFRPGAFLNTTRYFQPRMNDAWGEIHYEDEKIEKIEMYYGSGYLSQSSRTIIIPQKVKYLVVYDFRGNHRKIEFNQLALTKKNEKL